MADDRPNLRYVPASEEPAQPLQTPEHTSRNPLAQSSQRRGARGPMMHSELSVTDVIEKVIEMELRSGRLTPARRRRLVRYAASLGLSAREAGDLVQRCAERAVESDNPLERRAALRLVHPPADRRPWAAISAVIILGFAVLKIITAGVHW